MCMEGPVWWVLLGKYDTPHRMLGTNAMPSVLLLHSLATPDDKQDTITSAGHQTCPLPTATPQVIFYSNY